MRTRITKALTLAAASAALVGATALATAGTASAAVPSHSVRPVATRIVMHRHMPVRTERVWVKGHYVMMRVHGQVRREWIRGHYVMMNAR